MTESGVWNPSFKIYPRTVRVEEKKFCWSGLLVYVGCWCWKFVCLVAIIMIQAAIDR